jgi:predicted PolB exonuclease-like 3'-5' exonuclease
MTPILVFDLETIPDVVGLRQTNDWGDLSDLEVAERALAERHAKTGSTFLPHHLHKIAVIGCAFRDDNGFRVKCIGQADDPERNLIQGFFKTIDHYSPTIVSWNGSGFDLPVLHYRSLVHGVVASRYWDNGTDDRDFKFNNYLSRYHTRHTDLMDVLANYGGRANAPLDDLAKMCGFPGKLGMDGSKVWQAWQEGHTDEVRAYCETDVVNTWLVYCRFQLIRGLLTQAAYDHEIALVRGHLESLDAEHWYEYLEAWGSV